MAQSDDFPKTSASLLNGLIGADPAARAWVLFVERYLPSLQSWGRRQGLQQADADDLAGEVLLRLARALPTFSYDPQLRFRGWLVTVLKNSLANFRTRQANRPGQRGTGDSQVQGLLNQLPAMDDDELISTLDGLLIRDETQLLMQKALLTVQERVKPQTWRAFFAAAEGEKTGAEIAAELGMSIGAVYVAASRVKKLVQQEVERLRGQEACE